LREKLKKKGILDKCGEESFKDGIEELQIWFEGLLKSEIIRKDKDIFLFLEPFQIGDEREIQSLKKAYLYFS